MDVLIIINDAPYGGKTAPRVYYIIKGMLKSVIGNNEQIKACGGGSQARGPANLDLIPGVEMSNMKEFTQWIVEADKIPAF